jgi:hypothetical protein
VVTRIASQGTVDDMGGNRILLEFRLLFFFCVKSSPLGGILVLRYGLCGVVWCWYIVRSTVVVSLFEHVGATEGGRYLSR